MNAPGGTPAESGSRLESGAAGSDAVEVDRANIDRVVSLAPSATATLTAMGAADLVVGVTAHCALDRPVVGGWLNPDYDRLADLDPDLVCTADALQADVRDELRERGYDVHHAEPDTLDAVVDSFAALGRAVGRPDAGERLAREARERLETVRERAESRAASGDARPVVYCEEWGDPPMAAGNWVPEAVEAAGGRYPFRDPGERSTDVSREDVEAADPDYAIVHHCGRGDRADPDLLDERGWDLDATVRVLDDDLLNQPSPALLDGVERLAELFHGEEP